MPLFEASRADAAARARETVEECRRKLKESPGDAGTALRLADALAGSGRKREAVQVLNRLGPHLQKHGRLVEAIAVYRRIEALDPSAEVTSSFLSLLELRKLLEAMQAAAARTGTPPDGGARPPASGSFGRAPGSAPPGRGADGSVEVGGAEATEAAARHAKRERVHEIRAAIPLLKDIPPFLFDLVLERISLVTLEKGAVLFSEGDPGSSLFLVATGSLRVTARSDAGEATLLSVLGPGDVAGEMSFLTGLPRAATLTAAERSDLLELDRNALTTILRKHRAVSFALTNLYSERLLDGVLARSRVFGVLPRDERDALARQLTPMTVRAGERIIEEGASDSTLYLLKRGAARVTVRTSAQEVALALLRPHDVFGEVAAARGRRRTASVTAVTECELLALASGSLAPLLARSPGLARALEDVQLERYVVNARTLGSRA